MLPNNSPSAKSSETPREGQDKFANDQVSSQELTSQEMLQLAHNHEKFISLLTKLLSIAEQCIQSNNAQEGIQYLVQGQKILEYAASCGKNIDRNLILSVIHNQAYGYQRMWELPKCSNYLEAVIYNMYGKFSAVQTPISFHPTLQEEGFPLYDIGMESTVNPGDMKLIRRIDNNQKLKLCKYHLQYSAVNSQLKNHRKSADSSNTALTLIKQIFNSSKNVNWSASSSTQRQNPEHSNLSTLISKGIANIELRPNIFYYKQYKRLMKFLQGNWEERVIKNYDTYNSPYFQIYQYLKKFTIGAIMQIKAYSKQQQEYQTVKFINEDYTIESCQVSPFQPTYQKTLQQVLYLCTCLFTYSTELRLSLRTNNQSSKFKTPLKDIESQKKQAQINHMISMIIFYIYVPFQLDFIEHLEVSYKKNYSDTENNYFYGKIRQQMLNHEEISLLNSLDPNFLRNYKYQKEKEKEKSDQPIIVNGIKTRYSPQPSPKRNNVVRRLESKCKKIISEKYIDQRPQNQTHESKNKSKVKKCITTLNNTHQNYSSSKTLLNVTGQKRKQLNSKSKSKKKSVGKSKSKKSCERIFTQNHQSMTYYNDWSNNQDYQIFSNMHINAGKKESSFLNLGVSKLGENTKKSSPKVNLKNVKSKQKGVPSKNGETKKRKINIRQLGVTITGHTPKKMSKSKNTSSSKKILHNDNKKSSVNTPKHKKQKEKGNFTNNYGL